MDRANTGTEENWQPPHPKHMARNSYHGSPSKMDDRTHIARREVEGHARRRDDPRQSAQYKRPRESTVWRPIGSHSTHPMGGDRLNVKAPNINHLVYKPTTQRADPSSCASTSKAVPTQKEDQPATTPIAHVDIPHHNSKPSPPTGKERTTQGILGSSPRHATSLHPPPPFLPTPLPTPTPRIVHTKVTYQNLVLEHPIDALPSFPLFHESLGLQSHPIHIGSPLLDPLPDQEISEHSAPLTDQMVPHLSKPLTESILELDLRASQTFPLQQPSPYPSTFVHRGPLLLTFPGL
jgi:hypothetical protein